MRKLIIASSILAPAVAFAGGYVIPNENARELALSQAAVAAQTGPEALFLNTAALAGPEGLAITLNDELLLNRTTWSDPASGGEASLIPQYNTPPNLGLSFGKHLDQDMAFGLGVGLTVPAGGSLVWPKGWQGQEYIQSVKQQVFLVGAGAGFQFKYVKVGASYLRYQATEELHQSLNFLDHQADGGIGLSGGANSWGLALELKVPTVPLTLAANYHHSGKLNISGDAHFTGVPPAFSTLVHDQKVTEELPIPNELTVGAAYAVQPNVTIMGAYSFERWSIYDTDTFVGADGFQVVVPRDYNNAHVYRLGAEWQLAAFPALTVRGGGLRSISSQPTDTISPSLTDGNSWAYSIGCGANVTRSLRIDFGYQHAIFDKVTATGTDSFPGSYKTHVDLLSLGLNWRTDLGLAHH